MSERTNIDDMNASGELSEQDAAQVAGGRIAPVKGGGATHIKIDTIYSDGKPTSHNDPLDD